MYTNKTLSNKRDQKTRHDLTKNILKEPKNFILRTADDSQSFITNVNDEITKNSAIEKKSEPTDQPQQPKANAANKSSELIKIDVNASATESTKNKVFLSIRKRHELEANTPKDDIDLTVFKKIKIFF